MPLQPNQFRRVRVFVSSTFVDMHDERDYLNQFVFPRIKEYCASRKIEFTSIDLRWGITEEESRNGQVLNACLDEVDQARPYFIALLGKRYGWIPSEDQLVQLRTALDPQREWLKTKVDEGASMTEIEIDYATQRAEKCQHAVFYLRSDDSKLSHSHSEPEGSSGEEKLRNLKNRLRKQSNFPVVDYEHLEELGSDIYSKIISMIEVDFPRFENEQEEIMQQRHAFNLEERSKDMLIGEGLHDILEDWLARSERVFLIHGPSGIGTSTELAAAVRHMEKMPERFDVSYFDVEAVDLSISPLDELLDYICRQKNNDHNGILRIIAIDNVHFLSLSESVKLLTWLEGQPDNLRLAMASNSGSPMNAQLGFNGGVYTLNVNHGMSPESRKEYISRFTARYGKRFTPSQIDILANYKATPQVLNIVLNALINFGRMEDLDGRIKQLTKGGPFYRLADEGFQLFKSVSMGSVYARAIIAISILRNGISEGEMLDALQIAPMQWAIVKPYIMQFCKGNDSRFYLCDYSWNQDIKLLFMTNTRMQISADITDWFLSDENRWKKGLSSIVDAYFDVWHLPDDLIDLNKYKEQMRSLLINPDTVAQLDSNRLSRLWNYIWFRNRRMAESPKFIYGRPLADISLEEMHSHCTRMAEIALGLDMSDEAAYFYRYLAARYQCTDKIASTIYTAKALMVEGMVESAFSILKQNCLYENSDIVALPLTIQLQLVLMMSEGHHLQGDWNSFNERFAYAQDLEENRSDEFTIEDKLILCKIITLLYESSVLFGSDESIAELNPLPIEELKSWCPHPELQLGGRVVAQMMLIEAIRRYRSGLTDDMHRYLCNMVSACFEAFGSHSYQHGRALLIYRAFAWKNGQKIQTANEDYTRSLDYLHKRKYVRSADYSLVDLNVRHQLMREYDFFSNLDIETKASTTEQEKIRQTRDEFFKRVVETTTIHFDC